MRKFRSQISPYEKLCCGNSDQTLDAQVGYRDTRAAVSGSAAENSPRLSAHYSQNWQHGKIWMGRHVTTDELLNVFPIQKRVPLLRCRSCITQTDIAVVRVRAVIWAHFHNVPQVVAIPDLWVCGARSQNDNRPRAEEISSKSHFQIKQMTSDENINMKTLPYRFVTHPMIPSHGL